MWHLAVLETTPCRPLGCTVAPSISRPSRVKKHLLPARAHLAIFLHLHHAPARTAPLCAWERWKGGRPPFHICLSRVGGVWISEASIWLEVLWPLRSRPGRRLINICPRWQEALYQVDQRSRLDVSCGDASVSVSAMTRTNSRVRGFIPAQGSSARERSAPSLTRKARDQKAWQSTVAFCVVSPFALKVQGNVCLYICVCAFMRACLFTCAWS